MALSADEQDLFDIAREMLPHWFFSNARANEELGEIAKLNGAALTQVKEWLGRQTLISLADGPTSNTPDWLNQHAVDRGTRRQNGESDAALRARLQTVAQALIRRVLLDEITAILAADGITYPAYPAPELVELPRDAVVFGNVTANTGTGGTFSGPSGGVMTFTPTVKFAMPPFKLAQSPFDIEGGTTGAKTVLNGRVRSYQITFTGSTNAGNNGTFVTTGLSGNGVTYTNGSGVAGADSAPTWTVKRKDWQGTVLDGFKHSYLSRGDRIGRRGSEIIVILPFGTADSTKRAIEEMLRTKKAAGVALRVERRAVA